VVLVGLASLAVAFERTLGAAVDDTPV